MKEKIRSAFRHSQNVIWEAIERIESKSIHKADTHRQISMDLVEAFQYLIKLEEENERLKEENERLKEENEM